MAKQVPLIAVRVLNCSGSGSWAGVIAGVDWVTANHVTAGRRQHEPGRWLLRALDTAVRIRSLPASRTRSPRATATPTRATLRRRVAEAITVGASDETDARVVVLQLRHVRRRVRAGIDHPLRVVHERRRDEHDQRHVDGDPSRCRRCGAIPSEQPGCITGEREERHRQRGDAEPLEPDPERYRQPIAVLVVGAVARSRPHGRALGPVAPVFGVKGGRGPTAAAT